MKNFFIILSLIFTLVGCEEKHDYWSMEQFKLEENALANGESVSVVYYSRGAFSEDYNQDYYMHAVVTSQESGKKVNVLTFGNSELSKITNDDNSMIFYNEPQQEGETFPTHDRVARDKRFDRVADNNYPTVIGVLVKD